MKKNSLLQKMVSSGKRLAGLAGRDEFSCLREAVVELDDYKELKKIFGWSKDPVVTDDQRVVGFRYPEDVNERPLRDMECLGVIAANCCPATCLEIGTGRGYATSVIAENAPAATVWTVNIPPEEFKEGGVLTTMKLDRSEIGSFYRERKHNNVRQIFANTASWEPDMGVIDMAFIDGSHDTEFVVNDTEKILKRMRKDGFVMWHDFNLSLIHNYPWIRSVCLGVEELLARRAVKGRIFHIRNSWVGRYKVTS